ncbi:MAG: hypothetical protein SFW62_10290 [Alphaproteobacteria bacterium]|nr:hypothetical protein [Alphaproteobacteria bacterium]
MKISLSSFTALAIVLLVTAGCECFSCSDEVVATATPSSYIQLAPTAPPAPLAEEVPVLNSPQTTRWRPGYWSYDGTNFSWVSGEVIARPSPTAVWAPDRWFRHTYGWGFVPGRWE